MGLLFMVYGWFGVREVSAEGFPKAEMFDWRDGFWVAVNYSDYSFTVNLPVSAKRLIG
jgi:beta-galactosidase